MGVSKMIINNGYDSNTLNNDIALLQLTANLTLGQTQAKAVTLPANGSDPTAGTNCTVAGWGTTSENGQNISPKLLKVIVPIVARSGGRQRY